MNEFKNVISKISKSQMKNLKFEEIKHNFEILKQFEGVFQKGND